MLPQLQAVESLQDAIKNFTDAPWIGLNAQMMCFEFLQPAACHALRMTQAMDALCTDLSVCAFTLMVQLKMVMWHGRARFW